MILSAVVPGAFLLVQLPLIREVGKLHHALHDAISGVLFTGRRQHND